MEGGREDGGGGGGGKSRYSRAGETMHSSEGSLAQIPPEAFPFFSPIGAVSSKQGYNFSTQRRAGTQGFSLAEFPQSPQYN